MKAISKISILFVLLLFSAAMAYSQCETYLQKANTLFIEKKYEDAKRQYLNYKECKPNATGIDAKIAECDQLLKKADSTQTNNSGYSRTGTNSGTQTSTITPTESETPKQERISGKIYIGIGSFQGYKNNEAETSIRNAFVQDGRFIVSYVQNTSSNQQTSTDVDYIVSGTCTLKQQEKSNTTYIDGGKYLGRVPITTNTPEIVDVALTLTNAKGEIAVSTTYNFDNLNRISGIIFPVKFTIKRVNGKKVELTDITGGTYFTGDVYNVYEVYSNGDKTQLGAIKIDKTNEHKITDNAKEIKQRFDAGANLFVEK